MNLSNNNHPRSSERKEESPPYCRIFVVCNKKLKENDLQEQFERFGQIEDLYMPRDRSTGDSKGVAYIKYAKTSSAAYAIQEMNMKTLSNDNRPLKVMVAANKNESISQRENEDRYKRLFIKVPRNLTESDIRHHFSNFGYVDSVFLHRDKVTEVSKGFAYVHYKTFYEAAKAYEECDISYKPVFATPKEDLKRSRHSLDSDNRNMKNNYSTHIDHYNSHKNDIKHVRPTSSTNDCNVVTVKCSPQLPKKYIEKLFNIVPGMVNIQYSLDSYNGISKAIIIYDNAINAAFAIEKLHNYEFPSGEILYVKLDNDPLSRAANDLTNIVNNFKCAVDSGIPDIKQLADAIAKASSLITAATTGQIDQVSEQMDPSYCNISLPPPKPMVDMHSKVAQRLFILCKPQPPTVSVLIDVFCRFGDLIHVSTIPGKTFGFVKYASISSAQEAMKALNGAIITGIRLKVLEADEKPSGDEVLDSVNDNHDYDMETKRIKINED